MGALKAAHLEKEEIQTIILLIVLDMNWAYTRNERLRVECSDNAQGWSGEPIGMFPTNRHQMNPQDGLERWWS